MLHRLYVAYVALESDQRWDDGGKTRGSLRIWLRHLDSVTNKRKNDAFVLMRAFECDGEEMAEEGDSTRAHSPVCVTRLSFSRDTQFILSARSGEISLCLLGLAPTAITCF